MLYDSIYNLLLIETKILKTYIEIDLAIRFISFFKIFFSILISFI